MTRLGTACSLRRELIAFVVAAFASLVGAASALAAPQIWFIRHAESEVNVATMPLTVPDGGVTYPLTQKGVEQAKLLAAALAATPITKIYTSTQLRAVQTADALAFAHSLTLSLVPEAVEINLGIGLSNQDVRTVYSTLARKWIVEKDFAARNGEGESFQDVQRRFLPFVRELMNRHAHDSGVIVVMAHGATLAFMVPAIVVNAPPDFAIRHPLPNTGIIKTELRDSRLVCLEWVNVKCNEPGVASARQIP